MDIATGIDVQNKVLSVWTQIKNLTTLKHNLNCNINQEMNQECIENQSEGMPILAIQGDAHYPFNWQYVSGPYIQPPAYNSAHLQFGSLLQPCESDVKCSNYSGTIQVKELANWLDTDTYLTKVIVEQMCQTSNLHDWIVIGERKDDITGEIKYCDADVLEKVLEAKNIFDELDPTDLNKARARANPFETIKSAFFMNRAALKMANIDAATGFLFTGIDKQEEHRQDGGPYYFADICAGPGSFSEYVFWRKKWAFKGFGITLRGAHDFRLYESMCAPCETFEALYGVRNDGNVYYPDNIQDFCEKIKKQTNGQGVHFIMGDGGFSVEGQENIQEILSKQLYICQCFIALSALRTNGHFVVKLFDLFTEFSVGLIFLMNLCFHKVAVFKPNASRPANAERYLICCRKKTDGEIRIIRKYLEMVVHKYLEIRNDATQMHLDINSIVPDFIIKMNVPLIQYMINSNNRLAKRQTAALMKLALFCRDCALIEPRQEELRKQSLTFWNIPDKAKQPRPKLTVHKLLNSTISNPKDILFSNIKYIAQMEELDDILGKSGNWNYTFVSGCPKFMSLMVYAGLGLDSVYKYFNKRWIKVDGVELIRGTILLGEVVTEYVSENGYKDFTKQSLHVIDALRLGDVSLTDLPYSERKELINIYCKAVNKGSRADLCSVRSKAVLPFHKLSTSKLISFIRNGEYFCTSDTNSEPGMYTFPAKSLLLLQTSANQYFCNAMSSGRLINIPTIFDIETKSDNFHIWNCVMEICRGNK